MNKSSWQETLRQWSSSTSAHSVPFPTPHGSSMPHGGPHQWHVGGKMQRSWRSKGLDHQQIDLDEGKHTSAWPNNYNFQDLWRVFKLHVELLERNNKHDILSTGELKSFYKDITKIMGRAPNLGPTLPGVLRLHTTPMYDSNWSYGSCESALPRRNPSCLSKGFKKPNQWPINMQNITNDCQGHKKRPGSHGEHRWHTHWIHPIA